MHRELIEFWHILILLVRSNLLQLKLSGIEDLKVNPHLGLTKSALAKIEQLNLDAIFQIFHQNDVGYQLTLNYS